MLHHFTSWFRDFNVAAEDKVSCFLGGCSGGIGGGGREGSGRLCELDKGTVDALKDKQQVAQ